MLVGAKRKSRFIGDAGRRFPPKAGDKSKKLFLIPSSIQKTASSICLFLPSEFVRKT